MSCVTLQSVLLRGKERPLQQSQQMHIESAFKDFSKVLWNVLDLTIAGQAGITPRAFLTWPEPMHPGFTQHMHASTSTLAVICLAALVSFQCLVTYRITLLISCAWCLAVCGARSVSVSQCVCVAGWRSMWSGQAQRL